MGFETKDHIADQERLSKLFVGEWGGEAIKTPMYWPFDYVIQRNSKTYAVECRQRYNEHDLYPTLNLAVKKWQSLQFSKRLVSGFFLLSDGRMVGDGWKSMANRIVCPSEDEVWSTSESPETENTWWRFP